MLPNNQLDTTTYANRTKSGLPKRQNQTHHSHKNQTHTCWVYCKAPLLLACLLVACFQLFRCHGHQQAPHECPELRGSTSKTPDKTKTTPTTATKIESNLAGSVVDLPAICHTARWCWSSPKEGRCSRGAPKSCPQVPAGQTTSTSRVNSYQGTPMAPQFLAHFLPGCAGVLPCGWLSVGWFPLLFSTQLSP